MPVFFSGMFAAATGKNSIFRVLITPFLIVYMYHKDI